MARRKSSLPKKKNVRAQPDIDYAQARAEASCLNESIGERSAGDETMVTTIILALAVLTAALVIGVFVVALVQLNAIDEIGGGSRAGQGNAPQAVGPATVGAAEA